MRGTANATPIFVEVELSGECFHSCIIIRSVIKSIVPDSEVEYQSKYLARLANRWSCWSWFRTYLEGRRHKSFLQLHP